MEKVKERYNPKLRLLGVLLGNFDSRPKLDADIQKMLSAKFGENLLFSTVIHRSVKHREASIYNQTIFEHAPGQQASDQYLGLAREAIVRLEKSLKAEESPQEERKEVNRGR